MNLGDWYVYCDICGKKIHSSQATKLSQYTGKGGLIVCQNDIDKIDYGLMPFRPRREHLIDFVRINHTSTDNAAALIDTETMTYQYYLATSQDNAILMASQDDAWLKINEPI